jgi:hypothetical protein
MYMECDVHHVLYTLCYPAYRFPGFVPVTFVPWPPAYWYPPPPPPPSQCYFQNYYRAFCTPRVAPARVEPAVEETAPTEEPPSSSELDSIHQQISRIREDLDNLEKRVPKPKQEEAGGFSESVLRLNGAIRHVAVLDSDNNLLEFRSREENLNPTLRDVTKDFMAIGPLIMAGAVERLRPFYGEVNYIVVRMKECLLFVYEMLNRHIVLLLEPSVNIQLADQIAAALQELIVQV